MSSIDKQNTSKLKNDIAIKKLQISNLQIEIEELEKQLLSIEWIEISWQDLENWLKENGKKDRLKNPRCKSIYDDYRDREYETYCYLSEEEKIKGQMIIGGYYHNDRFKRGQPLKVKHNFEPYR
jgi:hypothetical protein